MIALYPVERIRKAEQAHAHELEAGILMERAAFAVAMQALRLLDECRGSTVGARVVVVAGSGNNGGDALFAGAVLAQRGVRVDAVGAAVHPLGLAALLRAGGRFARWDGPDALALIESADVVIDGIVGIGAAGALRGRACEVASAMNSSSGCTLAVDLPSGIDAQTGQVPGVAVEADLTVTFGAAKPGLLIAPGARHAGAVHIADIGIADALGDPVAHVLARDDIADFVPMPDYDDHKYRRGVVGIAAGSARYPGAALLATQAAVAGDVGMVRYLDRGDGAAANVIAQHPSVVLADGIDDERTSAWAAGPGFPGSDADAQTLLRVLGTAVPVIIDAGGLAVLAADAAVAAAVRARTAVTIVTPHDGEFARLGGSVEPNGRLAGAQALAADLGAVVLLKGPTTIVASPTGAAFVDAAGSPALATAGSGDVLTGLIGALLAGWSQRHGAPDADIAARIAAAACWLHGTAARLAALDGLPVAAPQIAAMVPATIALVRESDE